MYITMSKFSNLLQKENKIIITSNQFLPLARRLYNSMILSAQRNSSAMKNGEFI